MSSYNDFHGLPEDEEAHDINFEKKKEKKNTFTEIKNNPNELNAILSKPQGVSYSEVQRSPAQTNIAAPISLQAQIDSLKAKIQRAETSPKVSNSPLLTPRSSSSSGSFSDHLKGSPGLESPSGMVLTKQPPSQIIDPVDAGEMGVKYSDDLADKITKGEPLNSVSPRAQTLKGVESSHQGMIKQNPAAFPSSPVKPSIVTGENDLVNGSLFSANSSPRSPGLSSDVSQAQAGLQKSNAQFQSVLDRGQNQDQNAADSQLKKAAAMRAKREAEKMRSHIQPNSPKPAPSMPPPPQSQGDRLRELRKSQGFSQSGKANPVGIGQPGKIPPPPPGAANVPPPQPGVNAPPLSNANPQGMSGGMGGAGGKAYMMMMMAQSVSGLLDGLKKAPKEEKEPPPMIRA